MSNVSRVFSVEGIGILRNCKSYSSTTVTKFFKLAVLVCIFGMSATAPAFAESLDDFVGLSLEDLLDVEVTSVSRKAESLRSTAAAIHVISQNDIRNSGATSIPELLRMVPGIHVARMSQNIWAVGVRGFNSRFSQKLLVLQDGRTLYTPVFSGVFWDIQDTPLEDIERIEVIRGPGATLWGANAVNGVINIITKNAKDTEGGLVTYAHSTIDDQIATARYAAKVNDDLAARVFAKYRSHDDGFNNLQGSHDNWEAARGGFRADWTPTESDQIMIQSDFYDQQTGVREESNIIPGTFVNFDDDSKGFDILARWTRNINEKHQITLQSYFDHMKKGIQGGNLSVDVFDIEFQHDVVLSGQHRFVWGLGYRNISDELSTVDVTGNTYVFTEPSKNVNLYSGFSQVEFSFLDDSLKLVLGTKLEDNEFTGFEVQPNFRAAWMKDDLTLWGSVARAVRTPSRAEDSFVFQVTTLSPDDPLNPSPFPVNIIFLGNKDIESETVVAYELGMRKDIAPTLGVDLTLFYNDYENLLSARDNGIEIDFAAAAISVNSFWLLDSMGEAETYGGELTLDWRPNDWWSVSGSYSYLTTNQDLDNPVVELMTRSDTLSAKHQVSVRSTMSFNNNITVDIWPRYVDSLGPGIDSYVDLDLRLGWQVNDNIELSLTGRDLLDDHRLEAHPDLIPAVGSEPERSLMGTIRIEF